MRGTKRERRKHHYCILFLGRRGRGLAWREACRRQLIDFHSAQDDGNDDDEMNGNEEHK